jgi:outer membrane immunogenic protein
MFRNLFTTVASVIALASAADAADMYRAPEAGGYKDGPAYVAVNWSGFYAGVDVGGAWAKDNVSPTVPDGGTFPRSNALNPDGVFGGGTLGYNWQRGAFVFGIEGDLGGLDLKQSRHDPLGGTEIDHIDSGLYGDVTGRLGYAFDRILVYGKGGFAFYDGQAYTSTAIGGYSVSKTSTFTGWTAGAGVEYKINPAWSIKGEYLYFDFGDKNAVLFDAAFPYKNHLTAETAKFGINYHFWSGYEPLK